MFAENNSPNWTSNSKATWRTTKAIQMKSSYSHTYTALKIFLQSDPIFLKGYSEIIAVTMPSMFIKYKQIFGFDISESPFNLEQMLIQLSNTLLQIICNLTNTKLASNFTLHIPEENNCQPPLGPYSYAPHGIKPKHCQYKMNTLNLLMYQSNSSIFYKLKTNDVILPGDYNVLIL